MSFLFPDLFPRWQILDSLLKIKLPANLQNLLSDYFYAFDEHPLQDFILIIRKWSYLGFFGVFFFFSSLFFFNIPENIKQISHHLVK